MEYKRMSGASGFARVWAPVPGTPRRKATGLGESCPRVAQPSKKLREASHVSDVRGTRRESLVLSARLTGYG